MIPDLARAASNRSKLGKYAVLPNGDPFTVRVAAPIVVTPLLELWVPRQLPTIGVTVYAQVPGGTSSSLQLVAATVPLQVPIGLIVAAPPPEG